MNFTRTLKHLFYPGWWLRRDFPASDLAKIESTIKSSESKHSGEIRFAIESSLPLKALWNDELTNERALEVFSLLKVWDTEDNNGVLIYILLADHKVEITADRNINKVVGQAKWQRICKIMESHFRAGNFGEGAVKGIEEIGKELEKHFPIVGNDKNELPNKPVIL
ncbi:MAG: TPM domain-containing protein [Cocleimonas sp.]